MNRATFIRNLLTVLTILSALMLMGGCFIAYFPIESLPILDVIGILVPTLVLINFLFFIFWIFTQKKYALIPFVSLLLGFLIFGSIYQIKYSNQDSAESDFSILSYNVQGFSSFRVEGISDFTKSEIYNFIVAQEPDILCFQEYGRGMTRSFNQYPYRYQTPYRSRKTIQAIFSKYPIIGSGSLDFPNSANNAIYADVVYGKDTLRVYNLHLQSYWIYSFSSLIKRNAGKDFLKRLQHTADKHREQAAILDRHREASPYPVVFCGDFNQPPYSPSFTRLSQGMKDTFREQGKGWGTTFRRNYIAARIDFILADEQAFDVLEHRNFDLQKSDHLPVMARLKYLSD